MIEIEALPNNKSYKPGNTHKRYTKDELINLMQKFAKENNRCPEARDFIHNDKYPHHSTIQRIFGTWNNGLIAAGLEIEHTYTKQELVNYLIQFTKENGRVPMQKDFVKNPKYPGMSSFQRAFEGSFNNALKAAGLEPNKDSCTKEEIIKTMCDFASENGRPPTSKEFINNSNPKYCIIASIIKEFGSWDKAKIAAGFAINNTTTKARQCEVEIFKSFKNSGAVDLAGNNRQSSFDGLCPKGKIYDVKSSKLYFNNGTYFWKFNSTEEQLRNADYFFLGAYDKEHKKLMFMWRVDRAFMKNRKYINIGKDNNYEHNNENMKKYDITDMFIQQGK